MKNYYLVELKNGSRDFKAICEEKIVPQNIVKDRIEGMGSFFDIKAFRNYYPYWKIFRDVVTGKTIYDPKNYPNGSKDSALVYRTIDKISREEALKMLRGMFPHDINAIQDIGLTICSFSYISTLYPNADAKTLRSWGTNYIMANNIDE